MVSRGSHFILSVAGSLRALRASTQGNSMSINLDRTPFIRQLMTYVYITFLTLSEVSALDVAAIGRANTRKLSC